MYLLPEFRQVRKTRGSLKDGHIKSLFKEAIKKQNWPTLKNKAESSRRVLRTRDSAPG